MELLLRYCRKRYFNPFLPNIICLRTAKKATYFKAVKNMFGVPPYLGKSMAQKLEAANYKDPNIYYKVDIGLPQVVQTQPEMLRERMAHLRKLRDDPELEKKSRENKLSVCLDNITKEWIQESAPQHIKAAAEHYGIFQDLFEDAFFYPRVNLDVAFKHIESLIPIYRGNLIKPSQALSAPDIMYDADPDSLWTLVVTNPDGHLLNENAEYLHWFLGNIPGNNISRSEVIADYIQPFPTRGTGFHRFIFILYKQTEKLNYSSLKIPQKQVDFRSRTFRTYDFYRKYQDQLTPAGLAFSQVDWDFSVSRFFHTELGMEEPLFEYDFPPHYHPRQKMFPIRQAFNLYMDRYRDPKQIAKEYLLMKLKDRHPFEASKPPVRFPNAGKVYHDLDEKLYGKIPAWLRKEKQKQRLGYGRINDY